MPDPGQSQPEELQPAAGPTAEPSAAPQGPERQMEHMTKKGKEILIDDRI